MFDADRLRPRQAHGPEVEEHTRIGLDLTSSRHAERRLPQRPAPNGFARDRQSPQNQPTIRRHRVSRPVTPIANHPIRRIGEFFPWNINPVNVTAAITGAYLSRAAIACAPLMVPPPAFSLEISDPHTPHVVGGALRSRASRCRQRCPSDTFTNESPATSQDGRISLSPI
jgi:hypothetical protein